MYQTTPAIRFKGFGGEWENKKLGELAEFNPKGELPETFEYVDLESVIGTEMVSHRTEQREFAPSRAQRLARKGDVFYQTVRPYQRNNYLFALEADNYVFSTGYAQLRPYGDSQFLLTRLQENRFVQEVLDRCTGTSYPAINSKDLAKITVQTPDLPEQSAIGSLFQKLDRLIVLHQDRLELMRAQKQTYLKKMFPQKGQKVPDLRFAGFTDEWEEKKLGEVGSTQSGIGFPDSEQGGKIGVPFFKVSDMNNVGNEHQMNNANNYVTAGQISNKSWKVLNTLPAVIFAKVGAAIMLDRKRLVEKPFLIDNNMMAYSFDSSWDSYFGKILFETIHLSRYAQVGALPSYNSGDIETIGIRLPNLDEQATIGNFFQSLDKAIALQESKVEELKNSKKKLLQEMFV